MELKEIYEEFRNTWEQMKGVLEEQDKEIKSFGQVRQEVKDQIDRLNARLDQLEVKLNRPALGGQAINPVRSEAKEAFFKMLRYGYSYLTPEEKQYVPIYRPQRDEIKSISGDDTSAGYLAPPEYVREIIKGVVDFSPIRELARVRTTSNRSVLIPVRKGTFAARWVSEVGQRSETGKLSYGREELPTHELFAEVIISEQDLEDSAFDLETEIRMDAAEQFGVAEGEAFIKGSGVGQPEGLLVNPEVEEDVTGVANDITADALIKMAYNLKASYARNATWIMNRKTIGKVRMLKDQSGQYIWQPALALGQPNTILDRPYVEAVDMPEVAANSYPVLFGDIRRAYTIVDRVQMVVKRLVEKYAESGEIAILIRKRVGGQVVLPEAVRKLKVSA